MTDTGKNAEDLNCLKTLNILSDVLGLPDRSCFTRSYKITRNPDIFRYDASKDYKEDFELVDGSYCSCGCKTAVYVKEEWDGDSIYTEIITQSEYENLPDRPKPTKKQTKLEAEINTCIAKEKRVGIIHGHKSCGDIPVPKLKFRGFEDE